MKDRKNKYQYEDGSYVPEGVDVEHKKIGRYIKYYVEKGGSNEQQVWTQSGYYCRQQKRKKDLLEINYTQTTAGKWLEDKVKGWFSHKYTHQKIYQNQLVDYNTGKAVLPDTVIHVGKKARSTKQIIFADNNGLRGRKLCTHNAHSSRRARNKRSSSLIAPSPAAKVINVSTSTTSTEQQAAVLFPSLTSIRLFVNKPTSNNQEQPEKNLKRKRSESEGDKTIPKKQKEQGGYSSFGIFAASPSISSQGKKPDPLCDDNHLDLDFWSLYPDSRQ